MIFPLTVLCTGSFPNAWSGCNWLLAYNNCTVAFIYIHTEIQCLSLTTLSSICSALVCIQVVWWFHIKNLGLKPLLIATKHLFYCSSLYLHPHVTVTTEPFSRECIKSTHTIQWFWNVRKNSYSYNNLLYR